MSNKLLNRVPPIIILYWVIKIASTTLGETGADMFSMTLNLGYGTTIAIFMAMFLFFLAIKMRIKKYDPTLYWLTFTATAIVGTAISDFIDRTLGIGYASGSIILVLLLLVVLVIWYQKEKSISVESITTTSAELFYWLAFLIANTLGTAVGDFMADDLGLGFMLSAGLISLSLLFAVLLYYYTRISRLFIFWLAFVMTRPFGATFGDLLTKSTKEGGIGFGTIGTSIIFLAILMLSVSKEIRVSNAKTE